MIAYDEIREVHLEISTFCNAACPLCPRNFYGYPYNDGYPELNLSLENSKKIFSIDFLKQLSRIRISGNFGDFVMNPEGVEIVEYFRSANKELKIGISTNGSARDKKFWSRLANAGVLVSFCLDGLEDTHRLYRQNTSWKTIIKNASTFISHGGHAIWQFVPFDHNIHQLEKCKQLSIDLGFKNFEIMDQGRNSGPVFNKNGNLTHIIGNYQGPTDFQKMFFKRKTDLVLLEDISINRTPKNKITCKTQSRQSIYIAATGDVFPCCWTGFYPGVYGHGGYHQAVNSQLVPIISPNNALEKPLIECISWFNKIEKCWKIKTYEEGRLVVCDDICGSKN